MCIRAGTLMTARAEQVLRDYIGPASRGLESAPAQAQARLPQAALGPQLRGRRPVGRLIEPLEASGIGLIETAAYLVSYLFPHDGELAPQRGCTTR
jgi:tryptophan halogenase